jgi:hypothetical protein
MVLLLLLLLLRAEAVLGAEAAAAAAAPPSYSGILTRGVRRLSSVRPPAVEFARLLVCGLPVGVRPPCKCKKNALGSRPNLPTTPTHLIASLQSSMWRLADSQCRGEPAGKGAAEKAAQPTRLLLT